MTYLMLYKKTTTTTDYNAKISDIEKKVIDHKYITTSEFNKLTTENLAARLAQAKLATKTDFDTKLIIKIINKKQNNSNKIKHLLVENEF